MSKKTKSTFQDIDTLQSTSTPLVKKDNYDDVNIEEIKRKSINGVFSFFMRTAFLQGIGLAAAFTLSAFLSPEEFGVYGFVIQIIGLLVFFSDIGLAAALIQKKDKPTLTDYRTAFTLQQILSWVIVAIIGLIIATGIVQDKVGDAGVLVLLSLAISFPLATFKTIPSIIIERRLDFNKLVMPQIFEQLVFNGILIVLAWKGYGVRSYTYAILARSIVGVVIMSFIQPWKIGLSLNRKSLDDLLGYGFKFQLNDFIARVKDQLFYLTLGLFMPLKEFGYLQWAKNWSMYPYNLTVQNVMSITFPTFSRLQAHKKLLQKAIEKSIFFITMSIFPLLVGMSIFMWPLTEVIPSYHKWQPAVPSFIFFALSIGWAAVSTPLVNTLNAIGKINQTLKLMTMWTLLTWILTPILVKIYGFNGVAFAAFLISFTSIFSVYYVRKVIPVRIWPNVWRQLLASIIMGVVGVAGMQIWSRDIKSLFTGMILTGCVYIVVVSMVGWKKIMFEIKSLRNAQQVKKIVT